MRSMEKVERYRCRWCGREFKTPDRHLCRFDPDAHNCLSCIFRGDCVSDCHEGGDYFPKSFHCAIHDCIQEGGLNDFPEAVSPTVAGTVKCDDWKMIEGWKGKETYSSRLAARYADIDPRKTIDLIDDDIDSAFIRRVCDDNGFLPDTLEEAKAWRASNGEE